jgi:predicted S18 family serine protease
MLKKKQILKLFKEDKKKKKDYPLLAATIKVLLIVFIISGIYYTNSSNSNSLSLLAVTENSNGDLTGGSLIELSLKTEPGSGNIFVNLGTVEEIDTQISIINSQKVACRLFELDCSAYDFYYTFESDSFVLKGPSASSAIAILVGKTLKGESLGDDVVITGSLNSGGVIGNVGGVDEKIELAKEQGFSKVIIPSFSNYDANKTPEGIEVVKAIDIIEAYNHYPGESYNLETSEISTENYDKVMGNLATQLCERAELLETQIESLEFEENSSEEKTYENAQESLNSSRLAKELENYYSQGSFCYNANINLRTLQEGEEKYTTKELDELLKRTLEGIRTEKQVISTQGYKSQIQSLNDLYVYLILTNRLNEAEEMIQSALEVKAEVQVEEGSNFSESLILEIEDTRVKRAKTRAYANAKERLETVELWEKLMTHSGTPLRLNEERIEEACTKVNNELVVKQQVLKNYAISAFDENLAEQQSLDSKGANKYLCLYNGLELSGRINTVLNSAGIQSNNTEYYTEKLHELVNTRLSLNNNGDFPLIPYIYYEYSGDLLAEEDYLSSMLYSNFALAYTDLNILLEEEKRGDAFFNLLLDNLLGNLWFIAPLLVLLAFLS